MKYTSTRSSLQVSATQAILQGLSQEGGLFIPETIIPLDLASFKNDTYPVLAEKILALYFDDIPADSLKAAIQASYSHTQFTHPQITGIHHLNNTAFLELYYGKTCAFKDMALSLFPHLVHAARHIQKQKEDLYILTATSGDTGKAAMEAIADQPGLSITVLYPKSGVSDLQQRQMQTQQGANVNVYAVEGNFDDAQRYVKQAFHSSRFSEALKHHQQQLSSANSINIARLLPQVVYYVDSYMRLVRDGQIEWMQPINVSVPTGNFGNLFAGFLAKQMGLPIQTMICASNENNVLTDFIQSGHFNLNERPFVATPSPSMDILRPSNLERFLYWLTTSSQKVSQYMDHLQTHLAFHLSTEEHQLMTTHLKAYSTTNQETLACIQQTFKDQQYLIDPHTAVAYHALKTYQNETSDSTYSVVVSTASPYKFIDAYRECFDLPIEPFAAMKALSELTQTSIPESLSQLEHLPIRFNQTIALEELEASLIQQLEEHPYES